MVKSKLIGWRFLKKYQFDAYNSWMEKDILSKNNDHHGKKIWNKVTEKIYSGIENHLKINEKIIKHVEHHKCQCSLCILGKSF